MRSTVSNRDVIVPCEANRHKVRLARGRRFWGSARCPVCRSAVDPKRYLRVLRWITNLKGPASPARHYRAIWWAAIAYLASAVLAAGLLWWLSDHWWPATTLLFGPRWVLLLPLLVLLPATLRWDRPLVLPLVLAGLVVLGPVMGLRTGWRRVFTWENRDRDIRVASFNVAGGRSITLAPTDLMLDWGADVAAFQECGGMLRDAIGSLRDWHTDTRSSLCLISRFEILETLEMDREALQFAGGAGLVVTYLLDVNGEHVLLTNIHLETPRAGLEQIRAGRLDEGVSKLEEKSSLREIELRRARRWVDRFSGPQIVTGDFNTPPESPIYRDAWSDWQNAFSLAGRGFGGTRMNGWIRARIDHILANDEWKVVRSWVARGAGSDHRPIVAVLRRRSP